MHWSKLQVYLDSTRGQNYLAMLYDHKAGSECGQKVRFASVWRNDRILWTGFKFCFLQNCNKIQKNDENFVLGLEKREKKSYFSKSEILQWF